MSRSFVVAVVVAGLAGLAGCSSKPAGSETATTKVPIEKIQGKVQIQLQPSPSEAGLNSGGPSVFLWEGVRRNRLFFKTPTEVTHGGQYVAEGVLAQRVIDEIGDPDHGKNGYPLEASCARVVKMVWPGESFDLTDAQASSLRSAIKRYPGAAGVSRDQDHAGRKAAPPARRKRKKECRKSRCRPTNRKLLCWRVPSSIRRRCGLRKAVTRSARS